MGVLLNLTSALALITKLAINSIARGKIHYYLLKWVDFHFRTPAKLC